MRYGLAVLAFITVGCSGTTEPPSETVTETTQGAVTTSTEAVVHLQELVAAHVGPAFTEGDESYVSIGQFGETLFVDLDALGAALEELGFGGATLARIENTRALDGTQTATAGDLTASWTYHPDDGLQVVIERTN